MSAGARPWRCACCRTAAGRRPASDVGSAGRPSARCTPPQRAPGLGRGQLASRRVGSIVPAPAARRESSALCVTPCGRPCRHLTGRIRLLLPTTARPRHAGRHAPRSTGAAPESARRCDQRVLPGRVADHVNPQPRHRAKVLKRYPGQCRPGYHRPPPEPAAACQHQVVPVACLRLRPPAVVVMACHGPDAAAANPKLRRCVA